MKLEPNLTPTTFDEWLAGLDVRPADQRPGQWAVNTLPRTLWIAVNCTPFDSYHIGERLPDLIRYARHWWGVMECDRDMASIPACVFMAVKRGKVPGDSGDCAPRLEADDARRDAATAHLTALECAVIDGVATDEQLAEHAVLRDASWVRDDSRIVAVPAPVFYGYDYDARDRNDDGEDVEMESP